MPGDLKIQELLDQCATERGVDLRGYKPSAILRRLAQRRARLRLPTWRLYGHYLDQHPEEIEELRRLVMIPVTSFFRDGSAWETLRRVALPGALAGLEAGEPLRVWCAGCSGGEEVYSLAILLAEALGRRRGELEVKIFGTDVDEEAVRRARAGVYRPEQLRRLPRSWRHRYFTGPGRCQVALELRHWTVFGRSDLRYDPPIAHVRLLLCRNVLIYFDHSMQTEVLARLHFALEPSGVLFLGRSESVAGQAARFRPLHPRWRLYAAQGPRAVFPLPAGPPPPPPPASPEPATSENELQFAYEELQATNEELQSANEELETMNEQLQSSNEAVLTSVEELQSLNEALAATNRELAARQGALDRMQQHHLAMLERLPWPVLVLDGDAAIRFWNRQAQARFRLPPPRAGALSLQQLPLPAATRLALRRQQQRLLHSGQASARLQRQRQVFHLAPLLLQTGQEAERQILVICELAEPLPLPSA